MKLPNWIVLFLICWSPLFGGQSEQRETVSRIARNLMCRCGCPHLIGQCGDECGLAPQLIQKITQMVAAGQQDDEVYSAFEAEFGLSVLAMPKAEGFNLLAWILPFAGLLAGIVVIVVVVRNLKPGEIPGERERKSVQIDEKYRRLLEKELNE